MINRSSVSDNMKSFECQILYTQSEQYIASFQFRINLQAIYSPTLSLLGFFDTWIGKLSIIIKSDTAYWLL